MNRLRTFGLLGTEQRSDLLEAMFLIHRREHSVPIVQIVDCGLIPGISGLGEIAQQVSPERLMGAAMSRGLHVRLTLEFLVVPVSIVDRVKHWINVLFGLAHFKKIKDTHGPSAGDDVPRTIGTILNWEAGESIRHSDVPGRYGGEEFCLLLPETHPDGARKVADRARKRRKQEGLHGDDETFQVTCSIGVSHRRPGL